MIYGIHPIDENLFFLKKLIQQLQTTYPGNFQHIRLGNNKLSHDICVSKIRDAKENDLICFFCHGRTDSLLGCSYKADHSPNSGCYVHGKFIDAGNIEILKDKKVFCLACDSNHIGRMAIEAGAKVFLGFDDIHINHHPKFNLHNHVKGHSRLLLCTAVFSAMTNSINKNYTFNQFADRLKLLINRNNDVFLSSHKGKKGYKKYYVTSANILQEIKEGIKVWGDGNVRVVD